MANKKYGKGFSLLCGLALVFPHFTELRERVFDHYEGKNSNPIDPLIGHGMF